MQAQHEQYQKKREKYLKLARKCEAEAKADPVGYRQRVQKFSRIGYWYIGGVIAFSLALLAVTLWLLFVVQFTAYTFFIVPVLVLASIAKALMTKPPTTEGVTIPRAEAPKTFEFLDSVSAEIGAPPIDVLTIDCNPNASCVQFPKKGWKGPFTSILHIGFPFIAALSNEEMRAVVAHEMAHFAGRHGEISLDPMRQSTIWEQMSIKCGIVLLPFLGWYKPRLDVKMIVLRRELEYQCDRAASELVGAEPYGLVLAKINVIAAFFWKTFMEKLNARVALEPTPPENASELFITELELGHSEGFANETIAAALAEQAHPLSSDHPTLSQRLIQTGWSERQVHDLENRSELAVFAKEPFLNLILGECADLLGRVSDDWRKAVVTGWEQEHATRSKVCREIEYLQAHEGSQEEILFNKAKLIMESGNREAGERVLLELVQLNPDHVEGNFAYGCILAERYDTAAEQYLVRSMEAEPKIQWGALKVLFHLFLGIDEQKAARYRKSMEDGKKRLIVLQQAVREIKTFDKLVAFPVRGNVVQEITTRAEGKKIESIYSVRKVLKNSSVTMLLIRPQRPGIIWIRQKDADEMNCLSQLFSDFTEFDFVRVTRPDENWLKRKLSKVRGAAVFTAQTEREAA